MLTPTELEKLIRYKPDLHSFHMKITHIQSDNILKYIGRQTDTLGTQRRMFTGLKAT